MRLWHQEDFPFTSSCDGWAFKRLHWHFQRTYLFVSHLLYHFHDTNEATATIRVVHQVGWERAILPQPPFSQRQLISLIGMQLLRYQNRVLTVITHTPSWLASLPFLFIHLVRNLGHTWVTFITATVLLSPLPPIQKDPSSQLMAAK